MNENFEMDPERVRLFFDNQLADDELTVAEIEWLEDAVREAVMRKVSQPVH